MMDIQIAHPPQMRDEQSFKALDYQVMGIAFELQNDWGNLRDESEYRTELSKRCRNAGQEVHEEVLVRISLGSFQKNYVIDLLINGAVYELKAVCLLNDLHEAQTLNYLFLTNTQHGKLINFGQESLKWRFISTSLDHIQRRFYSIALKNSGPEHTFIKTLLSCLNDLLSQWGSYLSLHLYKEAICSLLNLELESPRQKFIPCETGILYFSALTSSTNHLEKNLQKYLNHTSVSLLYWINFNQSRIELTVLHHSA